MSEIKGNEFPSNARGQRARTPGVVDEAKPAYKKSPLVPIVTGNVKKKGWFSSLTNSVFADDTKSVGNYILYDILLPAAKSMISEMVGGGIEMLLFGERRGGKNIRRDGGRSTVTSYGEYYNDDRNTRSRIPERDRPRELSRSARSRHDFDEIIIPTRGEAERVLDTLVDRTIQYNEATVADLYELCNVRSDFTDRKYGWKSLRYAKVIREKNGYIIDLPETELLD